MQILILGMHRSGTSALARLVNMMGVYFGPEDVALRPADNNPKGFWERRDVMQINGSLLKLQGCRWYDLASWRFAEAANKPDEIVQRIQTLVHGMDGHRPWFIKDPRLCLTLPAWLPQLECTVAIVVYRDPVEIAISLQTRSQLPLEYSIALWEYHAVGLLNASRGMPRFHVRHADLLEKPARTLETLHAELKEGGVRRIAMPSGREVRAFIDPALYRSRAENVQAPALSEQQQALCEMLQGIRPQTETLQVSDASRQLMRGGISAT